MRRSTAAGIHYAAAVAALLAALLIYGAESAAVLPCDCPASAPNSFRFTQQRIGPGPATAHQPR